MNKKLFVFLLGVFLAGWLAGCAPVYSHELESTEEQNEVRFYPQFYVAPNCCYILFRGFWYYDRYRWYHGYHRGWHYQQPRGWHHRR